MDIGLQETNGHQYYKNWETMKTYHPMADAEWTQTQNGVYKTGPLFYKQSAGIFESAPHYLGLFG